MTCVVCGKEYDGGLQCPACVGGSSMKLPKRDEAPPSGPKMTGPERAMAQILDMQVRSGEVRRWWYECVKLKVGAIRCHYTPDFYVQRADGGFEFIEVKGPHIREDARVKYMAAAREHSWAAWRLMKLDKGEWITVHRQRTEAA